MGEDTVGRIRALEDRRSRALCEADVAALEAIFDDTLSWVHSNGARDSKAGYLEGVRSGRWKFRTIERANEEIRLYEGCAVVTADFRIAVEVAGVPRALHSRATIVWVEREAGWRMAAWHATAVPT